MHRERKPRRGIAPTWPTQRSVSHPEPVVRLTFSARVNCLTKSCARAYASAQVAKPWVHGDGYFAGEVWLNLAPEEVESSA